MGERIVLAVELNAADCTDPVSFLECIHELVGIAGASAFDRVGDIIDFVIGGVSGIGGIVAEFGLKSLSKGNRLRRHRYIRAGDTLVKNAVSCVIGILAKGRIGRL